MDNSGVPIVMVHINYPSEEKKGKPETIIFDLRDVKYIMKITEGDKTRTKIQFKSDGWVKTPVSTYQIAKALTAAASKRWSRDFPMIVIQIDAEK